MKRPNLTQAELDRIAELTEGGRLSAGQIAVKIGCSTGSVTWAQLRIGADRYPDRDMPPVPTERRQYLRNGHPVLAYTQDDDARLLKLEAEGLNPGEIGRRMNPTRLSNSVRGRLLTLGRRQARQERREGLS
ncbi:MAG: hypothetical protein ACK4OJ_04160 [Brevundimonas sp.]